MTRRICLVVVIALLSSGCVSMMRKRFESGSASSSEEREYVDSKRIVEAEVEGTELVVSTTAVHSYHVEEIATRTYDWKRVGYYDHWLMYIDGNLSFALDIPICLGWGLYALFSSEYEIAYGPFGMLAAMLVPGVTCNAESGDTFYEEHVDYSESVTETVAERDDEVREQLVTGVRISSSDHDERIETVKDESFSETPITAAKGRATLLPFVLDALRRGQTKLVLDVEVEK